MSVGNQKFAKYSEWGAYHWRKVDGPLLSRSPRMVARYQSALRLLEANISLSGTSGADVGCGDGVMLRFLAPRGTSCVGIDAEADAVALANDQLAARNLHSVSARVGSCFELPFPSCSLDYVVCLELIEHVQQPELLLTEIVRVLKKEGGVAIISTPCRLAGQKPDAVRDPYHVKEYVPSEFRKLLAGSFRKVSIAGYYPGVIENMCRQGALGGLLPPRIVRAAIKALAIMNINLFMRGDSANPSDHSHGLLVSSCRP